MPVQFPNLTADDQVVYKTWLRRVCAAYGIAMLLGVALLALLATAQPGNIAEPAAGAVTLAAD